ncbi:hypothetical protein KO02_16390 [Sphingobacterium sp. ML3W]|uniref:hypothetical protein n=1 Tax=Sphingobacterium sp. ML3W TaxID=1538644 RepID=UPI0004F81672|nr:hypothetical protein [Sphingobacterium sp. ML3W]AIM38086.1 hypothetical protein KO02_16390 [Sphingobacterium sp. ML3W]
MELVSGLYLNKFVAPQLLKDFRNYKDDFVGVIPNAPQGAVTADGLRANKLINNVDLLVNNTQPLVAKSIAGQNGVVPWDKLDTTPSSVTDKDIRALSFDLRAETRVLHDQSFKVGYRDYIIQKLAPEQAGTGMVFLRTTGDDDGKGRKRLTFEDLINFESEINLLNLTDLSQWFMNLAPVHQNDLKLDAAGTTNHRNGIRINPVTGEVNGFYKLKIFENNAAPLYTSAGVLRPKGVVKEAGDQEASIFYYAPNTTKYLNQVKILYKPETIDTEGADPESRFRLQVYGLAGKTQDHGFGALISGNV